MRAAPACQVSLRHFGLWRMAVLVLTALGVAAITAWALLRDPPLAPAAMGAATLLVLATWWLGARLARIRPADLRWDGQRWHLAWGGDLPVPGQLRAVIDLGPWMLLRFTPAAPGAVPLSSFRSPATWLPVQRRGLEPQWHALRCAVYSPQPAPSEA